MTEKDVLYLLEKYASDQDEYFWQGFYNELEKNAGFWGSAYKGFVQYPARVIEKLIGTASKAAPKAGHTMDDLMNMSYGQAKKVASPDQLRRLTRKKSKGIIS